MKGKPGRHAPAFVLLELAKGPSYGLEILNALTSSLAICSLDSAAIYRALTKLENEGCVESYSEPNPENQVIKKYYKITKKGHEELATFYNDISLRIENLKYFIKTYEELEE